jgi:Domain of Unknown Function (DUF1521)
MSLGVSNVAGANGALASSGLSDNGAVAAQNFLNALLGQEEAPRSGGEAFLADVKETKNPEQKRALIDGFAEGFAAASGAGESDESGPSADAASDAGPTAAADGAGATDAAEAGGEDEAASPAELMSGFQEIADRVADSDLSKKAKNTLLDGIATLMSKLQSEAPSGEETSPASTAAAKASGGTGESASASEADDASASENQGTWSHEVKDGEATIQLGDKYTVKASEKDATWTVTNNETGKTTKVSGDPHVDIDNDGKNDFDFKKDMTFKLDDGTKITVGTVPGGENGTTFSSSLTITNGDKAMQVTGLGDSHDGENNLEVKQSDAGTTLDELENDGSTTVYENGGAWQTKDGKAVDQSIIDAAEAAAA